MLKKGLKTICFVHYGIGWRDGVNTVFWTLAKQIQKQCPWIKLCFLGGIIKECLLKNVSYKEIPELGPVKAKLTKKYILGAGLIIAKKLAKETKEADAVIIENPFLGDYHLPAMLGYSIYARQYKPKGTKVFFRIHDFYQDFPKYCKKFKKLFSDSEIRTIIRGEGVDGFLAINQTAKEKLNKQGIAKEKIFYLPNGIEEAIFNKGLNKKECGLIHQAFKIPAKAKILLYPVRVVPRKNIEEAILLTDFIRQLTRENYILFVAGNIDKDDFVSRVYYQKLKALVKEVNFPVIFTEKALPLERKKIEQFSIGDLYQVSEAIVMTSIKEGFGYPFLECWFAKKIIIGRRLQEVISDFEKSGLDFSWLYYGRLTKSALIKTIEILQDKKQQKEIITANLKAVRDVYEISKVTKRFLELICLNK